MHQRRKVQVFYITSGIAVVCVVSGVVILIIWPSVLISIYKSQFLLKPNSKVFDIWKQNPFPLKLDFYFFNWTNPEDFYNSTIKPRFKEIGPYRFIENIEKVNITFHSENNTVSYKQKKVWHFDEEFAHKDSLLDGVTTVNPISLSATHTTRYWDSTMQRGLSVSINTFSPGISITKTVSQMLFEGYSDRLIELARILNMSAVPPIDRFGWFYTRNNSADYDGVFNIGSGANNDLGTLYYWNHWNQTPYFDGECGRVRGSAGELFTRNRTKDPISFFSPDMCRTVVLDYDETTKVRSILGYKYTAGISFLDNGDQLEENACNCVGDCLPSGAINISTCRYGSPGYVSLPHFYKADPYYTESVEGLEANKTRHEFYITLEPQTGIPLEVAARLQINMFVQPNKHVGIFKNARRVVFPMMWFEQKVQIPPGMALQLRLLLNFPIIFTTMGIILIFLALFIFSCICYKICTCKLCERSETECPKEQVPLNGNHTGHIEKTRS